MGDTNQERRTAVREAWKNERSYVRDGKGTRDWAKSEQREIMAKGRANGYEGHHMKSVKDYPQYAGDPKNIQFLNRNEHVNGAHRGNTQNTTNGYYNPQTGKMHSFGNSAPQAPQSQALSAPMTQKQQDLSTKREQARKQGAQQAKTEMKGKSSNNQQSPSQNVHSANKGIQSFKDKANRADSGSHANTHSTAASKSTGHSNASGQGR
jgi:hypothetical protein